MKRRNRELNVFGLSFMDVLANTVGGLAFLLIMAVLMAGSLQLIPPVVLTESLPDAIAGRKYQVWLAAREGAGQYKWTIVSGKLPDGISLNAESGEISGVPVAGESGPAPQQYEFEVACEVPKQQPDSKPLLDVQRLSLTVRGDVVIELPPLRIVTEPKLPDAYAGQSYPLAFAAEGGQPPYRWTATSALPAGMQLTPEGQIRGAPRQVGRYQCAVAVAGINGERTTRSFQLVVAEKHPAPVAPPPLRVVTEQWPKAIAEQSFVSFPAAEGGVPPYRWSLEGATPSWLKVRDSGVACEGNPTIDDIGRSTFKLQVTDSAGRTGMSSELSLEVLPPVGEKPQPLVLRTKELPQGRIGRAYHLPLSVEGGVPPLRWQLATPLPNVGIRFEQGVFHGQPTSLGSKKTAVTVTDKLGRSATQNYELRIRPGEKPLEILTKAAAEGRVGEAYDLALSATGGHPPYHWQHVGGELPSSLQFDTATMRIAGTPDQAGQWSATFTLRDEEGQTADEPLKLTWTVLTSAGQTRLQVKTTEFPTFLVGQEANVALACEGGRPPYRWEILGAGPHGLQTAGAMLQGTPETAGVVPTRFVARDSSGQQAEVEIPVRVRNVTDSWIAWVLGALFLLAALIIASLARSLAQSQPEPLRINTAALPNARASAEYTLQLSCIGGKPPYEWSIASGELPPGMSLSSDGLLNGRPLEGVPIDETQEFSFEVQVRDAAGAVQTQAL